MVVRYNRWPTNTIHCHDFAKILTFDELAKRDPYKVNNTRKWDKRFFDKYGGSLVKVTHFVYTRDGKYMRIKFIDSKCPEMSCGQTYPVYIPVKAMK